MLVSGRKEGTPCAVAVEAMFVAEVQGIDNFTITPIPEPRVDATMLAGLFLVLAGASRRRGSLVRA